MEGNKRSFYITKIKQFFNFFKIREVFNRKIGEPKTYKISIKPPITSKGTSKNPSISLKTSSLDPFLSSLSENLSFRCPYCSSQKIIKRGFRKKKLELLQLYLCKDCKKTFSPRTIKGKKFPLRIILDAVSFYNLGYSLAQTKNLIYEKFGIKVSEASIENWVKELKNICKYQRLRKFGKKLFSPNQVVSGINLYHRQIYKFRIHRAKLILLLQEDPRHNRLEPLKEFLEAMFAECPHHLFKQGKRISETKVDFSLNGVRILEKNNFAVKLTRLITQAISDNKLRHELVQEFFLYNDSVTVATEVPVYLMKEDIEHMEYNLGFEIPIDIERVITGHIDLIQLRNGLVHILDYKPNAGKQRPISQLTLYALAMSRLTGLRLYDFKCSWFDQNYYFEFYPLHVVYKLSKGRLKIPKNQKKLIQ